MLQDLGFDSFYRRPLPNEYKSYSAVDYEVMFEDQSVIENMLANGSVTDAKVKNISANKLVASTILVPVNLGEGENGKFIKLDGKAQHFLTHDENTNRIVIGEVTA